MYLLEYNKEQQAFHIDTLEQSIETNMRQFVNNKNAMGWVPIFMGTWEECSKLGSKLFEEIYGVQPVDDAVEINSRTQGD